MTLERNQGFEAAMSLWALSDLESAARDIISAANRLSNAPLIAEDKRRIQAALAKINFAFEELRKLSIVDGVAA